MNTIGYFNSVSFARPATLPTLAPIDPEAIDNFVKDTAWAGVGAIPIFGGAMIGIGGGTAAEGLENAMDRARVRSSALVGGVANIAGTLALGSGHPVLGIAGLALSGLCMGYASHIMRRADP